MRIKQVLLAFVFLGVFGISFIRISASDFSSSASINPIILPTSPFYFIKEWKRTIIRNFTPDIVSKTVFTIDTLDEKALEIKKIDQMIPTDYFGIKKSLDNYIDAQQELKRQIEYISKIRNERDREILLKKTSERLMSHNKFFDSLLKKYSKNNEINKKIISIKSTIIDTQVKISETVPGEKIQSFLYELFDYSSSSASSSLIFDNIQILEQMKTIAPEELKESLQNFQNIIKKDSFVLYIGTSSLSEKITTSTEGSGKLETCPVIFDPVCGKDSKTYSNSCIALSLGVEIKNNGECKNN